jgi:hypothetical protein
MDFDWSDDSRWSRVAGIATDQVVVARRSTNVTDLSRRQVFASGRRLLYVTPAVLAVGGALGTARAFAVSAPKDEETTPGSSVPGHAAPAASKPEHVPSEAVDSTARKPESPQGGSPPTVDASGEISTGGARPAKPAARNTSSAGPPAAKAPTDASRPVVTRLPRAGVGGPSAAFEGP